MNLETELVQADTKHANAMQQLQALNGGQPIEVNMTEYPQAPADDEVTMYEKPLPQTGLSAQHRLLCLPQNRM